MGLYYNLLTKKYVHELQAKKYAGERQIVEFLHEEIATGERFLALKKWLNHVLSQPGNCNVKKGTFVLPELLFMFYIDRIDLLTRFVRYERSRLMEITENDRHSKKLGRVFFELERERGEEINHPHCIAVCA